MALPLFGRILVMELLPGSISSWLVFGLVFWFGWFFGLVFCVCAAGTPRGAACWRRRVDRRAPWAEGLAAAAEAVVGLDSSLAASWARLVEGAVVGVA